MPYTNDDPIMAKKLEDAGAAAVMPLESWLDDATMQSIAAENNLAETAFFVRNVFGIAFGVLFGLALVGASRGHRIDELDHTTLLGWTRRFGWGTGRHPISIPDSWAR